MPRPPGSSCSPVDEGIVSLGNLRRLNIRVWILREVASVTGASDLRDKRHWEALLAKFEPVEVLKPTVILDVVSAVAQAPVTLRHISDEQVLDEALSVPNKNKFHQSSGETKNCDLNKMASFAV